MISSSLSAVSFDLATEGQQVSLTSQKALHGGMGATSDTSSTYDKKTNQLRGPIGETSL